MARAGVEVDAAAIIGLINILAGKSKDQQEREALQRYQIEKPWSLPAEMQTPWAKKYAFTKPGPIKRLFGAGPEPILPIKGIITEKGPYSFDKTIYTIPSSERGPIFDVPTFYETEKERGTSTVAEAQRQINKMGEGAPPTIRATEEQRAGRLDPRFGMPYLEHKRGLELGEETKKSLIESRKETAEDRELRNKIYGEEITSRGEARREKAANEKELTRIKQQRADTYDQMARDSFDIQDRKLKEIATQKREALKSSKGNLRVKQLLNLEEKKLQSEMKAAVEWNNREAQFAKDGVYQPRFKDLNTITQRWDEIIMAVTTGNFDQEGKETTPYTQPPGVRSQEGKKEFNLKSWMDQAARGGK